MSIYQLNFMVTPELIEKQIQLEREAIAYGLKKLHRDTHNVESRDYASASVYGAAGINTLLPRVVEHIKETRLRIARGKTGAAFKEIAVYLDDIEPEVAAVIACKLTFDKVFSYKDDANTAQNIAKAIGLALEQECQMRFYETNHPGLLRFLKEKYWHKCCGTQQKFVDIRTMMNRRGITWNKWSPVVRVKLGGWLLDCVITASGWFEKLTMAKGKRRQSFIVPTAEFMDIKDEVMANAELFSPVAWPMLIPPDDWTNETAGGYKLNEVMAGHEMVRRGDGLVIQGETPINFLNKVQKVALTLNPFVVEVAEHLQKQGTSVGKFLPIVDIPLPPKPVDIAENEEARFAWRKAAAQVRNSNAASFKQSCRTRMTMETVERYKDVDRFYLPWSFDYRGRAYPIPAFLTPQDTDFGKSLLKFAEGAFMTEYAEEWLAFQVATTYGHDKLPISERIDWTKDNHSLITLIVNDPIGNISEWEGADEPWQFLAACEEYYACVIDCNRHFTSLPVATDATCSGLQILAGLAKDANTARLVNVLPGDKPQDAYKEIAEVAKPNVPESVREHMDRKVTKRTVMTVPYNAKPHSNRQYIRDALKEKGVDVETADLTATVTAVRDAMDKVVPGPMRVMEWIEKEVSKAIKKGKDRLIWTTPSGFTVTQYLMKKNVQTVKLQLLGTCKLQVANGVLLDDEGKPKPDINKHKNCTAPNLIHSLDASLLHLTLETWQAPIAVIHDSVLCRATDMSDLSTLVRKTYLHLFAEHEYLTDFARQIDAETKPPIIGDLNPSEVMESTYFFC